MRKLKKLLFGSSDNPRADLADDVREAVESWRQLAAPDLDQPHFLTRYVVTDVATAGLDSERDAVLGIAGLGLGRGGVMMPGDVSVLDLPAAGTAGKDGLDRQLAAFLLFAGRGPLVTYQSPFVGAFLGRLFEERLGFRFQPEWIDLAWLLPDLFKEKIDGVVPMDAWLEVFGIEIPGRCDALADSLAIARLLQVALPRAVQRGADTPGKLMDIGRARRWLRSGG
ncbi:MAG: hypothetical protein H6R10_3394 [Rhodocyclaceae bacterium]|nr:hypothetical protein [Rhodocyclaceae bacterium]